MSVRTAYICQWPDSQYCMSCEFGFFIDIISEQGGSNWICTNQKECPHGCDLIIDQVEVK